MRLCSGARGAFLVRWIICVSIKARVCLSSRTTNCGCMRNSNVENCVSSNTNAFRPITVAVSSSTDAKHSCMSEGLSLRTRRLFCKHTRGRVESTQADTTRHHQSHSTPPTTTTTTTPSTHSTITPKQSTPLHTHTHTSHTHTLKIAVGWWCKLHPGKPFHFADAFKIAAG